MASFVVTSKNECGDELPCKNENFEKLSNSVRRWQIVFEKDESGLP